MPGQFQIAIQGDRSSTGNLVRGNIVCLILCLGFKVNIKKEKLKTSVRHGIAASELIVNQKVDGSKLIFGKSCFGKSKCYVWFGFWQG